MINSTMRVADLALCRVTMQKRLLALTVALAACSSSPEAVRSDTANLAAPPAFAGLACSFNEAADRCFFLDADGSGEHEYCLAFVGFSDGPESEKNLYFHTRLVARGNEDSEGLQNRTASDGETAPIGSAHLSGTWFEGKAGLELDRRMDGTYAGTLTGGLWTHSPQITCRLAPTLDELESPHGEGATPR